MKTRRIRTTHNNAVIDGWVDSVLSDEDPSVIVNPDIENVAGIDLVEGDVVIVNSAGQITTTTVTGFTGTVGVVVDDIDAGEFGPVQFAGPVDLVNVTASVTAGHYGQTSGTAGQAVDTGSTSPAAGSFVMFTSSGTTPSGFLGGGASSGANAGGDMMPYYIPLGSTFTVPLYRQGLYSHSITVDGALVIDGVLEYVS